MRNPLSYQMTEFDCGPTTLVNAISFLFHRKEIPPDIIRHIMMYSLDSYNDKGEFGKKGTSGMAMMFLANWLNHFGKVKRFPIHCEFLTGEQVAICPHSRITASLQQGGAVVLRLRYGCWHYALATGLDGTDLLLFDPYYRKQPFYVAGAQIVSDAPCSHNRRVGASLLNSEGRNPYALGPLDTREAVILFNETTKKTPARTIEYMI